MEISERGLALIKRLENYEPKPYPCLAGVLTIGYGHAINKNKESFLSITKEQAVELLVSDVSYATGIIHKYVKVPLTQGQFDALCSLIYNWGSAGFSGSAGLKLLNAGDYRGAAHEFFSREKGVVNIKGKFCQGLYNRRIAEMELWNV